MTKVQYNEQGSVKWPRLSKAIKVKTNKGSLNKGAWGPFPWVLGLGPGPGPSVHVVVQPSFKSHNRLLKISTDL